VNVAFNEPRYQIDASDFRCRACEVEIPCEAAYYSAVHFEGETFQRRNYCARCWASGDPSAPPAGPAFAFWRTRRPPLPADKPRRARFDPALVHEFFLRLGAGLPGPRGSPSPAGGPGGTTGGPEIGAAEIREREDLRFVLALLLIRKKVLELASSCEEDGVEWLKLATRVPKARRAGPADGAGEPPPPAEAPQPPAPAVHWVKSPRLSDAELERVKLKIGELLQVEV
jgi:hypothetical protein